MGEEEKEKGKKKLTEALWEDFEKAFELLAEVKENENEFWL